MAKALTSLLGVGDRAGPEAVERLDMGTQFGVASVLSIQRPSFWGRIRPQPVKLGSVSHRWNLEAPVSVSDSTGL